MSKHSSPKGQRASWLDEKGETPLIDDYAREMSHFLDALADGKIDKKELRQQEKRVVDLMKDLEPKLDDDLHAEVTRLLCEVSVYSAMQILEVLHDSIGPTKLNL
jgi:hypothetical protein